MTQGVVTGGWSFVVAAYSITAAVLVIYGISLIARLRDEERRTE
jgi:protein-S-isoprenylcysteine O-methyltransferase Ste14